MFLEKTQAIEQEDIQSESAYFGNVLEEVVAQEFAKRTRLKVQRRNAISTAPRVSLDACKRGQAHRGRKNWIRMQNSI